MTTEHSRVDASQQDAVKGTFIGVCLLALIFTGCGGQPRPVESDPGSAPLVRGDAIDYVPAAGLRVLIEAKLAQVAENPQLQRTLAPLFPDRRLDAYQAATGIDLRELETGIVASYDYSTLYVGRTDQTNIVREKLAERFRFDPKVANPHPELIRLSGVIGDTPHALVALDRHLVAVAVGRDTPALAVEGYALGRLSKSPPALASAALSPLSSWFEAAHVRLFALGPFEGRLAQAAKGLLRAATGLAIAGTLHAEKADVTLVILGSYEESDTKLLEAAFEDLAKSSVGSLLGLSDLHEPITVTRTRDHLRLDVALKLKPLVKGLHAAVAAEVHEMLDLHAPKDDSSQTEREATDPSGP